MKRFLTAAALLLTILSGSAVGEVQTPTAKQYDKLAAMKHPRLIATDWVFNEHKKAVAKGLNPAMVTLHQQRLELAAQYAASTEHLVYEKDGSGRRILSISRHALEEIFALAYAYRFKPSKAYVKRVESILADVCAFPDWNTSHFLDTAEMTAAVSIAYDWMYSALSKQTRAMVESKVLEYAIGDEVVKTYLKKENNWNQVCNGGIICGAVAFADVYPEVARRRIDESIKSNAWRMDVMYEPDGIYPEGPGYWSYGTTYQILLLTVLETAFGTDFGLSNHPGFLSTGRYQVYSESGVGKHFNFADNAEAAGMRPELWYFAVKNSDTSIAYYEYQRTCSKEALGDRKGDHLTPMYIILAGKCDTRNITPPASGLFYGQGDTPVAFMRNGWGKDNSYLAIKAGMGGEHHGHLDVGTFVYDAWGCRWAAEVPIPAYSVSEKAFKRYKASLWANTPESWRWKISSYNNFFHNTLTVNGKLHNPQGKATLNSTWQAPGLKSAEVDITAALAPDLASAVRTASLLDDGNVEIKDVVKAAKTPAFVRWTLVTPAEAEVREDGILLKQNGVAVLLKAEGAEVSYHTWPSKPDPATSPVADFDPGTDNTICGFNFIVPSKEEITIRTTMTRVE